MDTVVRKRLDFMGGFAPLRNRVGGLKAPFFANETSQTIIARG
jgi:hypothetical protein